MTWFYIAAGVVVVAALVWIFMKKSKDDSETPEQQQPQEPQEPQQPQA